MKRTAEKFGTPEDIDAQKFIKDNFYVDDAIGGCHDVAGAKKLAKQVDRLLEMGGFKMKPWVIGGMKEESLVDLAKGNKVLGITWDPGEETLIFRFQINLAGKNQGRRLAANLNLETIQSLNPNALTRRILLRVVNGIYDHLGLLSPVTILSKIWMKSIHKLPWDEKLSVEEGEKWIQLFGILLQMNVHHPRSF